MGVGAGVVVAVGLGMGIAVGLAPGVAVGDAVGLDVSDAHDPSVPASIVADLVEADIEVSTGRVFKAVAGKRPVLMADARAPRAEGVEIQF